MLLLSCNRIAQEYLASMKATAESSDDSDSDAGEVNIPLNGGEKIAHKLTQARLENQGKYFRCGMVCVYTYCTLHVISLF
jgi:hypothetical protein